MSLGGSIRRDLEAGATLKPVDLGFARATSPRDAAVVESLLPRAGLHLDPRTIIPNHLPQKTKPKFIQYARHYRPFFVHHAATADVPRQSLRCSESQVPQPVAPELCLKQNPLAPLPVAANSWPLRTQPSPAKPSQRPSQPTPKPVNVDSLFFSSSKPHLLIDHSPRVDRFYRATVPRQFGCHLFHLLALPSAHPRIDINSASTLLVASAHRPPFRHSRILPP